MDATQEFHITAQEAGNRVDAVLAARAVSGLSRSRLKALIQEGCLRRGGEIVADPAARVREGETYLLEVPPPRPVSLVATAIPFEIVYEDDHVLVINKPAGLTVHPAAGNVDHTLVNALLAYCGDSLSGIGGELRPGIVHRLDKDTSGVMVVAKHDAAHQALSAQLADRSLSRIYAALVWGQPTPMQGKVDAAIGRSPANRKKMAVVGKGGKPALTHYHTQSTFYSHPTARAAQSAIASLLRCTLQTGRTHQIRVHMTHAGHSLVGDPTYGGRAAPRLTRFSEEQLPADVRDALLNFPRQALHAGEIGFLHPVTGAPMRFSCNFPDDMAELIHRCEGGLIRHG